MRKPDPYQLLGLLLILAAAGAWYFSRERGGEEPRPGAASPLPAQSRGFDPTSPSAHRALADALDQRGHTAEAGRLRRAAARLEGRGPDVPTAPPPEPPPDLFAGTRESAPTAYTAVREAEEGKLDEALERIEKALASEGETVANLTALGYIRMHRAEPEPAETALARAIAADPSYAPAWLGRGILHLRSGRPRPAARDLRKACELVPVAAEWRVQLADAHRGLGEVDAALKELEQALLLSPGSPRIYAMVGDCLLRGGREEEARRWYGAALRIGGPESLPEEVRAFAEGR